MRGKTRGEARDELVKAGIRGERLQNIQPHKVGRPFLSNFEGVELFRINCCCFFVCLSVSLFADLRGEQTYQFYCGTEGDPFQSGCTDW